MKIIRILVIAAFALLLGGYLMVVGPTKKTDAAVYPGSNVTTEDGLMAIHPIESVGANSGSYQVDFQLMSKTGKTLHTTVVTHNFFCPNLSSDGKCYEHEKVTTQTVDVPAGHYIDVWSAIANPSIANQAFSNCGLYQIDLGLSYPGAHNNATYQAAGGMNTGKVCKTAQPTATPTSTPFPTSTATPIPTATITPIITDTPVPTATPTITNNQTNNCGDNNTTNQSGTNNNANDNCNQNNNNNNNQQDQNQTQNNNQSVNITLTNNETSTTPTVAPAPTTNSLPSTGTPEIVWSLFGLLPLGLKLRKLA